jgi:hypothetical protein
MPELIFCISPLVNLGPIAPSFPHTDTSLFGLSSFNRSVASKMQQGLSLRFVKHLLGFLHQRLTLRLLELG